MSRAVRMLISSSHSAIGETPRSPRATEARDNLVAETSWSEQHLVKGIEETPPFYYESTTRSSTGETASSSLGREAGAFSNGLEWRNVYLRESGVGDPIANKVKNLPSAGSTWETKDEKASHELQWKTDLELCEKDACIDYFQHTIMMSLPARHCLHLVGRDKIRHLLCSVKSVWTCPRMPTRAYFWKKPFLPHPKPDLAVCFHRPAVIPDYLWNDMPEATRRLVCYEKGDEIGREKGFHFLTIQTTRRHISSDEEIGMLRSLNNASQSLHNMFEFLRDAGPKHEKKFFAEVRFFSVVAGTEGLTIRIHRATRASDGYLIIPDYPLSFKHEVIFTAHYHGFTRKVVFDIFKKIQVDYGVRMLRPLLRRAAKDLVGRLRADTGELRARMKRGFYRYGQTDIHHDQLAEDW